MNLKFYASLWLTRKEFNEKIWKNKNNREVDIKLVKRKIATEMINEEEYGPRYISAVTCLPKRIVEKLAIEIGEERGNKNGHAEEKNTVAEIMIQANEPLNKITTYTGLTKEDVLKLKKAIFK